MGYSLPASQYEPLGQSKHSVAALPASGMYLPAGHEMHKSSPGRSCLSPGRQAFLTLPEHRWPGSHNLQCLASEKVSFPSFVL